ncbi:MAG: hypothetical protein QXG00_06520 [Candidatus Woesearchaeota archaeon]
MNRHDIDKKLRYVEKFGEVFGLIVGKIVKAPFRFVIFMFGFSMIAIVAFFYSFKKGADKS